MKWFFVGTNSSTNRSQHCFVGILKKDSKSFQRNLEANDNVTGGRRTDAAPENGNEMKMNTPSVTQKFSFQTGKQVARGKLAAGLKTKRGLLMSNHKYDDTFGPESLQILR